MQAAPVQFSLDTTYYHISDGHIKLQWQSTTDTIYDLQQSESKDFANPKTIYQGPDKASFISGLRDGTYYYRIRVLGDDTAWSKVVTVDVQHQSLKLAFALFGIGGVVFLLTVFVVVHGARYSSSGNL